MTRICHRPTFAVLIFFACAAISACDGASSRTPSMTAAPKNAPLSEAAVQKEVKIEGGEETARRAQMPPVAQDAARDGRNRPRRQPLNLSIPKNVFESTSTHVEANTPEYDDPLGLWEGVEEEPPLRIRGRLFMDREQEFSLDSLDGGQVIIEVPTR